ncbi:MAG: NAD(P)-binding domain-containing protein, partial [Rhodospirillaceae bacterium]|nr:NAD(P)-binding domain-containing protein [Rhodospirillaceae bacterium]
MATLLLVGCGKMGSALARGWLEQGVSASDITVVEPNPESARDISTDLGVAVVAGADALSENFKPDVVVVAVKPQILDEVIAPYARFV